MAELAFVRQAYDGDPYAVPTQEVGPVRVKFVLGQLVDVKKTEANDGKPIFMEQEYVEFTIPGDLKASPTVKATDRHRRKYAKEYEAFLKGQELGVEGTPLGKAGFLTKGHVMTLEAQGFRTVEEFAQTDDGTISRLGMGYRKLRDQARAYVAALSGHHQAEELAAMKQQIADLTALLTKATEPVPEAPLEQNEIKRGPGRPRKENTHEAS